MELKCGSKCRLSSCSLRLTLSFLLNKFQYLKFNITPQLKTCCADKSECISYSRAICSFWWTSALYRRWWCQSGSRGRGWYARYGHESSIRTCWVSGRGGAQTHYKKETVVIYCTIICTLNKLSILMLTSCEEYLQLVCNMCIFVCNIGKGNNLKI